MKLSILSLLIFGFFQFVSAQSMRNLGEFSSLSVVGDIRIEILPAQLNKVEFTIIKGNESDLLTEISSGELKIKFKNNYNGVRRSKADVKLFYKFIDELAITSGANLICNSPIVARNFSISCSSGAKANISIESNQTNLSCSSGSSLTVSGKTNNCTIKSSSGSSISSAELDAVNVVAKASSGGNISTRASESLDADSASGGRVQYTGEPKKLKINNGYTGGNIGKN